MKNKDFFYLQYNKVNWKNQEKTKINSFINDYIIQNFILKHSGENIAVFDIGLGIGFFIRMMIQSIKERYKNIIVEGCEPSKINYQYWLEKSKKISKSIAVKTSDREFQKVKTNIKFDFITAIYVFPHFLSGDFEKVVKKIYFMLKSGGKFILVLANEEYLERKLKSEKDLFIEKKSIAYNGKKYEEVLHYSDIPQIGKIIDYNREEKFYIDLFENNNFRLTYKESLDDNGFICTLFVFEK